MGTGLRPNRPPGQWVKQGLEMTKMSPQGPAVGKMATGTSRSLTPQGEIPDQVGEVIDQGGSSFISQVVAGRPGQQVRETPTGGGGNTGGTTGFPAAGLGSGKGMTSKSGVMGSTLGKGTF